MRILCYKLGSRSAKALSKATNIKRVRHNGEFRNNYNHCVISWGCSTVPSFPTDKLINSTQAIQMSANKLKTFARLKEKRVPIPYYTTDRGTAQIWVDAGLKVFERHSLTGHSGAGILVKEEGQLNLAPLYTVDCEHSIEYRVHIAEGVCIDVQEKRKRNGTEADPHVRNHGNGYVFCRQNVEISDDAIEVAKRAVLALGLNFGAVDLAVTEDGRAFCLEVNTAPALEGTTLQIYTELIQYYNGQGNLPERKNNEEERSTELDTDVGLGGEESQEG